MKRTSKKRRSGRPFVASTIVTKACVCNYSLLEPFFCCRFRSRTPGPPPFSSVNSTLLAIGRQQSRDSPLAGKPRS
jgi:hypothetical protein